MIDVEQMLEISCTSHWMSSELTRLQTDDDDKSLNAIDIRRNDQIPMMEINPSSEKYNATNRTSNYKMLLFVSFLFDSNTIIIDWLMKAKTMNVINIHTTFCIERVCFVACACGTNATSTHTHTWAQPNRCTLLLSWRQTKNLNSGRRLQR